jgi:N12 class adenine-specific DNA methylase
VATGTVTPPPGYTLDKPPTVDDQDVEQAPAAPEMVTVDDADVEQAPPAQAAPASFAQGQPAALPQPEQRAAVAPAQAPQPAGAAGTLPGIPQPQVDMQGGSRLQTVLGTAPDTTTHRQVEADLAARAKRDPYGGIADYGQQGTNEFIEGLKQVATPAKQLISGLGEAELVEGGKQLGEAWGEKFSFDSTDAKQGLTKMVNGLMDAAGSTIIGGSGKGLMDAAGAKGLLGRAGPMAARALAAAILGGYVTGKAARYGSQLLGLDADSQDLAEALGNIVGGTAGAHAAGAHHGQGVRPEYQAVPEVTPEDVEPEEPKQLPRQTLSAKGEDLPTQSGTAGKMTPDAEEVSATAAKKTAPAADPMDVIARKMIDGIPLTDEETALLEKRRAARTTEPPAPAAEKTESPNKPSPKEPGGTGGEPIAPPKGEVLPPEPKTAANTEAKKPATLEGKIGEKDPDSGRMILQPSDSAAENQKLATAGLKEILPSIKQTVAGVQGAEMAGVREEKGADRTKEKVEDENKPPATIPDYSALRISVDSPKAREETVAALRDQFPVVRDKDEFDRGSPAEGFHAQMLQVQSPNGASHELQVLPKEQADIAEDTHELYEKARDGDKEAQAQLKEQNVAAMERFNARQNTDEALNSFVEKVAKRHAMEGHGQDVLDRMDEAGESPSAVSDKFWGDTYFKLPAAAQQRFSKMLKGVSGFEPGDTIAVRPDKSGIVAKDWQDVAKGMLPDKVEHLEGTERGLVALMKEANDRISRAGNANAPKQELLPAAGAEGLTGRAPTQTAEPKKQVTLEGKVTGFQTSQGSTYAVDEKGTTQRIKSQHVGHLASDVGEKERSEQTVYVKPEHSRRVGELMSLNKEAQPSVRVTPEGLELSFRYGMKDGKPYGNVRREVVPYSQDPKVGSAPVELWGGGRKVHAGNEITSVSSEKNNAASGGQTGLTNGKSNQHVLLPDGRSARIDYYDGKLTKRARVTTDDGTRIDSVPGKSLTPVQVQPQKPGEPWVGVDLDKTLAKYNTFQGPTVIGKPIPAMVDRIKQHIADGDNVRIVTARVSKDPDGKIARAIQAWSQKNLGVALPVTDKKDEFMTRLYDDKAIQVVPNSGELVGGENDVKPGRPVASAPKQGENKSTDGNAGAHPASLDTAGGGRPSSDTRGADRDHLATAPEGVREATPIRGSAKKPSEGDGAALHPRPESIPEQGAKPGPRPGSDTGTDLSPGHELAEQATKKLKRPVVLNREWYAHPADWKGPPGGEITRLDGNIAALQLLRDVEKNPHTLTDAERQTLANYVGWGSLPNIFDPYRVNSNDQPRWRKAQQDLQKLLGPEEYAAARRSTQNAHYTSPEIVRFMWDIAQRLGFKTGNVLEPSMGTGNFFGMMPAGIRGKVNAVGNEMDSTTFGIAKLLYPGAQLFNKDFVQLIIPDNEIDFAIGNVPFGENIFDPKYPKLKARIHDYFFVKSLDKVKPGGVIAYITSTGTMDKISPSVRNILASKADLVGAFRLPANAFKSNAGTSVTTDLIILRKRMPGEQPAGEAWNKSPTVQVPQEKAGAGLHDLNVNEYYQNHPDHMLGTPVASGRMYGGLEFMLKPPEGEFGSYLDRALQMLPKGIMRDMASRPSGLDQASTAAVYAPDNVLENQYVVDDKGQLRQRVNGKLVSPAVIEGKDGTKSPSKAARIRGMVGLREVLNRLMSSMATMPDDEQANAHITKQRAELQRAYDAFVKQQGLLSSPANGIFKDDLHYPRLLALENYNRAARTATPADIFNRRTMFPREPLRAISPDPKEALQQILGERGYPDIHLMAQMQGKTPAEVAEQLTKQGLIFRDPDVGDYQTREKYLSGYVRDKLASAKAAVAQGMKEYEPNVKALEKAMPADIVITNDPATGIAVRLGSSWIPTTAIQDFFRDTLKSAAEITSKDGVWKVKAARMTPEITTVFGTPRATADDLLQLTLNLKSATVYDRAGDKSVLNQDATTAARAMQEKIASEFQKWATQSKWKGPLEKLYNQAFNNLVTTEYDGSHLTFPGMSKLITLKPHQVNAVWRILQDGRGLLAHEVGAGKTFEMAAAAMEARRVGTFKKPMLTVPNHIVEQFRKEFMQLYPGANLLVPTEQDFDSKNRQRIMAQIATGNYDAIILPHSQFNLMDISPARQAKTIQGEMDELEETIRSMREAGEKTRSVKEMEKAKERLKTKLDALMNLKADRAINFDDTGVDALFVDEAHKFKNLSYYTKMTRVAGLQQAKAKSALRLKMKTEYLQDTHRGRGVIFATGTPVQNTMAELYTMMKYVAPDVMEKAGIRFFDDWAANFGQVITAMELSADGRSYKARAKFARFQNVPELMQMFRSFADVKTAADLDLPRPALEGGKPTIITVPGSDELEQYVTNLMARAEAVKTGHVDPKEDNMLKVTTDGRKAATDMRLIDPAIEDEVSSKINIAVSKMVDEWRDGKDEKLTQMAFLDLYRSIDEGDRELINLYNDMRNKLVVAGVPRNEIALIGEHDTRAKRQLLFDKVNSGDVRILLGSTEKMGAGTNAQKRLKALHHIDLVWRPGDLSQREGRILRQGNMNKEVRIYNYLTAKSFDAYMAQTLQGKAEFIGQVLGGKSKDRVMADAASDMVLSLEEMKIAASGNPDVRLKYNLELRKAQLLSMQRSFEAQQRGMMNAIRNEQSRAAFSRAYAGKLDAALRTIERVKGDDGKGFALGVDGKKFTERSAGFDYLKSMKLPPGPFWMDLNGIQVAVEPPESGTNLTTNLVFTPEYANGASVAPEPTMESLGLSLESRLRHVPDTLDDQRTKLAKAEEDAAKFEKLARQKDFPEQAELDTVLKEIKEVEGRLGLGNVNAGSQAAGEAAVGDVEAETPDEEPEEEGEEKEPEEQEEPGEQKEGTTFRSGFLDPELFKQVFGGVGDRIGDWLSDDITKGDEQAEMMRQTRGDRDRGVAMVAEKLSTARRGWMLRSRADSMAFWNAIENEKNGAINTLPAKDQPVARFLHGGYTQIVKDIQKLKPEALQHLYEDYFGHIWKQPTLAANIIRAVLSGKRPFAGRASFLKMRTVPTMQDGIDMGLTPMSWNPIDMFLMKYNEMAQFLMGYQTLDMMKDAGTAKFVRVNAKHPDGWKQLDDKIGTVISREDNGDLVIRGHYWAPADAAQVFNNYVSRGISGRGGVLGTTAGTIYDALSFVNNNMNALQLGISAFHFTMTSLLAPVSDIALSLRQLSEGKPIRAVGNALVGFSTVPSVLRTAINGHRLMREYLSPGSYARMAEEARMIAVAGGRHKMNALEIKPFTKMVSALRNGAIAEGLSTIPATLLQATVAPVMDFWVPRMKLGAFYQMAHDTLSEGLRKGWSQEEIRRQVQKDWNSADNRFGQVVGDNKFWHRIIRDVLQLGMRSVGWNHGSVDEGLGGVKDALVEGNKALHGELPKMTNRTAFDFALPIYFGVAAAVLTYLSTGKRPDSLKHAFYWKRADGTYVSLPGYMKDYIGFMVNPAGTVINKMAPIWEALGEMMENKDFYGVEVRHKDDPWVKQLAEYAKWASRKLEPFAFEGTQKLLESKGEDASFDWHHPIDSAKRIGGAIARHPSDALLGNLGFQPAPAYIQNSPALNMARDYERENAPPGTKTQSQADHAKAMHAVESMYRTKNVDQDAIRKYVRAGKLSEADVFKAQMRSREDPLRAAIRNLSIEQALNVYEAADKTERESIRTIVERKAAKIPLVENADERKELEDSYRRVMGLSNAGPAVAAMRGAGGS